MAPLGHHICLLDKKKLMVYANNITRKIKTKINGLLSNG